MTDEISLEEAKRIRAEQAENMRARQRLKTRQVVQDGATSQLKGFRQFIRSEWVFTLAVGLALGIQFKALVDQILVSFINPILSLILPGKAELVEKTFSLTVPALDKTAIFRYGAFINVFIGFLTVLLVIYIIIKSLKVIDFAENPDKKRQG